MRGLIRSAVEVLEGLEVPRPQWTAEQILAHHAGCLPFELYAEPVEMDAEGTARFRADVAARAAGVPLQYLTRTAEFYGREFSVGPGVFNPRPETEVLMDVALAEVASAPAGPRNDRLRVVDVGTGSGAIAVTLALERPGLRVWGVERSEIALSFARHNAREHAAGVRWVRGDLVEPLARESVDLLTANLPYLDPQESSQWPKELHWEPWLALNGGSDGVDLIRRLLSTAGRVLALDGKMVLEIGLGQADTVCSFAEERGFHVLHVVRDLAGLDRIVVLESAGGVRL